MMFQMQRCLHEMVGMLQQQQREITELMSVDDDDDVSDAEVST